LILLKKPFTKSAPESYTIKIAPGSICFSREAFLTNRFMAHFSKTGFSSAESIVDIWGGKIAVAATQAVKRFGTAREKGRGAAPVCRGTETTNVNYLDPIAFSHACRSWPDQEREC